ncbi:unnamed protein product [Nezara viridula]|uniref:EF-hand domain-containing protein n=1 Tax=Nezara viridula TaxID=85310 RepID=A0A9P0HFV5_NEZVI|nr:unnamed protein product [Nezara viridula]
MWLKHSLSTTTGFRSSDAVEREVQGSPGVMLFPPQLEEQVWLGVLSPDCQESPEIHQDEELEKLVDVVLKDVDRDMDGYITYSEFLSLK